MKKINRFVFAILFVFWSQSASSADDLGDQIDALTGSAFQSRLEALKDLDTGGLITELETVLREAGNDLSQVKQEDNEAEQQDLQEHYDALKEITKKFKRLARLEDFGAISSNQFITDDTDDCVIADATFSNHRVFDCDAEYQYAINIWQRTEVVSRILNTWKEKPRIVTLNQIRQSEIRWENFSSKVTSDQFPWETIINGWLLEGTIATPPTEQFRLLHPVALLSYSEEAGDYNEELGLEVFGWRTFSDKYDPEWGISLFALLESENATETGVGISLSLKNFTFGVVQQDTEDEEDDIKILLGVNLASLFENTKNDIAEKKMLFLDRLKQKVRNIQ